MKTPFRSSKLLIFIFTIFFSIFLQESNAQMSHDLLSQLGLLGYLLHPSTHRSRHAPGVPADPSSLGHTGSAELVRKFAAALYEQQNPKKHECKHRRLLAIQFSPKSFEGIGSILKLIALALAEAAHSNRTLVWGLDLPFNFEHTRHLWAKPKLRSSIKVGGGEVELDCTEGWKGQGGGAYSCFFEPISTCSLADATLDELYSLGRDGFRDEARIRIAESQRRGISAYHIPDPSKLPHFAEAVAYLEALGKQDLTTTNPPLHQRKPSTDFATRGVHEWAAALASYSFRLKGKLLQKLEIRRMKTWPKIAGGNSPKCFCKPPSPSNGKEDTNNESVDFEEIGRRKTGSVWGMHVRNGDVSSLAHIYGNRKLFSFDDFFESLWTRFQEATWTDLDTKSSSGKLGRSLGKVWTSVTGKLGSLFTSKDNSDDEIDENVSNFAAKSVAASASVLTRPSAIYVTSDNPDTAEIVSGMCGDFYKKVSMLPGYTNSKLPCVFIAEPSERFRTIDGSHTVAADGGCIRDVCALPADRVVHHRTQNAKDEQRTPESLSDGEISGEARAHRIMRTLFEAVEDIYMLSYADSIISQGTSHFSTIAVLLSWARTGTYGGDASSFFLDHKDLSSGLLQPGFIHGSVNQTSAIAPSRAAERWGTHTKRFIEGLSAYKSSQIRDCGLGRSLELSITGPGCKINTDISIDQNGRRESSVNSASDSEIEIDPETGEVRVVESNKAITASGGSTPSPSLCVVKKVKRSDLASIIHDPYQRTRPFMELSSISRLRMQGVLPVFSREVFLAESKRWVPSIKEIEFGYSALQTWVGECPIPIPQSLAKSAASQSTLTSLSYSTDLRTWVIENINLGAEHSEIHPNQAMRCWNAAKNGIELLQQDIQAREKAKSGTARKRSISEKSQDPIAVDIAEFLDVLDGNLKSTQSQKMFPYSMGENFVRKMIVMNLDVKPEDMN
jgi:hypothetical protein